MSLKSFDQSNESTEVSAKIPGGLKLLQMTVKWETFSTQYLINDTQTQSPFVLKYFV